jgi:hypothetical protein
MNSITKPNKTYLLKEVVAGEVSLREASAGEAFIAKKGAIYTLLDATDLDPIDLVLAVRQGNTLVVTLPDGSIIKLEGFFPEGTVDINEAFARFSENTTVDFRDDDDSEKDGSTNWTLWGLGGAAALGGAYLLSSSQDADGSDISVSVDSANSDDGSAPAGFSIRGVSSRRIDEGTEFSAETPTTANGDGEIEWSLEGEDAGLFIVDPSTGVVNPAVTFDFEAPVDANKDNRYRFTLVATDSAGNEARKPVDVYIDDAFESATLNIDSLANNVVEENQGFSWNLPELPEAIGRVQWSLSGDDAGIFTIDESAREIRFEPKNFESPRDLDKNNSYSVRITATDQDGNTVSKLLEVVVSDANEAAELVISGVSSVAVLEDLPFTFAEPKVSNAVGAVEWSLLGEDASFFNVNAATGAINFVPKDYENPEDSNADNIYSAVLLVRDDDGNQKSQPFSVSVINRSESTGSDGSPDSGMPDVNVSVDVNNNTTTDGDQGNGGQGGDSETPPVDDGSGEMTVSGLPKTAVQELESIQLQPWVEHAEGAVSWSLEGADAALSKGIFSIDSSTGAVTFNGQDFEGPKDVNRDNTYEVVVRAVDANGIVATKSLKILVVDDKFEVVVDNAAGGIEPYPSILSVREGDGPGAQLAIAAPMVNEPGQPIFWRLAGVDSGSFDIDSSSGELISKVNVDFERPLDSDLNNSYELQLIGVRERVISLQDLTNDLGLTIEQALMIDSIRIKGYPSPGQVYLDGDQGRQLLEVGSQISVEEVRNDQLVYMPVAGQSSALSVQLLDSDLNTVNEKRLEFVPEPGYRQTLTLQVLDVDEGAPEEPEVISDAEVVIDSADDSNVGYPSEIAIREGELDSLMLPLPGLAGVDDEQATVAWSLSGEDSEHFEIDPDTGKVSLKQAFDYELAVDTNKDNLYRITLVGRSGDEVVKHPMEIRVLDVDEGAPEEPEVISDAEVVIDSADDSNVGYPSEIAIREGELDSLMLPLPGLAGVDDEQATVAWSLSGEDSEHFEIDPDTGKVSLKQTFDYELAVDTNKDNLYRITLVGRSGDEVVKHPMEIRVLDVDEGAPEEPEVISDAEVVIDSADDSNVGYPSEIAIREGELMELISVEFRMRALKRTDCMLASH